MITAKNVFKAFGDDEVLHDISTEFRRGDTNLIIGQSGSGKTVLIKCLVGLHEVTSGAIFFDEKNFTEMGISGRKELRTKIGMLFQGGALFDSMSVEENVMFPLELYTKDTYKQKLERVNFCLEKVDLAGDNGKYPGELSGGMVKRVAIARAIALNPDYLFCDEPNSGLDPRTASRIDNLIYDLTKEFNMTTVINTHDMNSVLEIGDNVLYIENGRAAWKGNKDKFLISDNESLNNFIYTNEMTRMLKKLKKE
jgi:phospholipid/cholesterol/gamma-HCH transport system ATP-binding protein